MPAHFGVFLSHKHALVLQPATGRQPAVLFLISDTNTCCKLELDDSVFTPHRTGLNLPLQPAKHEKEMSQGVQNGLFINEHMKEAIDKGSFKISDDPSITLTYNIAGIEYTGLLKGFSQCTTLETIRVLGSEVQRAYDRMHDMIEAASTRGVDLKENDANEIIETERIQQAELRRKQLSAVNPMMRAKKVAKGFGRK